jgi:hypothetical protein
VTEEKEGPKKRGPKGGVKHTPGHGHRRKSGARKRIRFQRKAERKRKAAQEALRRQWSEWEAMPPNVQKFFPEKKPKLPRPNDEE